MRTKPWALYLALSTLSALACANVQVRPVENEFGSRGVALAKGAAGVRFYRPAPHVWLTQDAAPVKLNVIVNEKTVVTKENGGTTTAKSTATLPASPTKIYSARLVMLPDYSQEYIIQWSAGAGSVKPKFTLTDGWNLASFTSEIDSQVEENISALSGAVKNVAAAAAGALVRDPQFRGAGLYRLRVRTDGTLALGELVLGLE